MKEFVLPELGENITSAVIVKILVQPGDSVAADQSVLEIETDKATIEVPSTISGKVTEVAVKDGDTIKVGAVIFRTDESSDKAVPNVLPAEPAFIQKTAEPKNEAKIVSEPAVPQQSSIVDFCLPELGENITTALVVKVSAAKGDIIKQEQSVLEIETDKATIEVPSSFGGEIIEVLVEEGKQARVGDVVLRIKTSGAMPAVEMPDRVVPQPNVQQLAPSAVKTEHAVLAERPKPVEDSQPPVQKKSAPAAPSVRRIARELGVDINKIPGSGAGGRISMDDVKAYVKALNEGRAVLAASENTAAMPQMQLPDFTKYGEVSKEPMNNIRQKTAAVLSYAWNTIPHVTQFDKADITELEKVRKALSPAVSAKGGKLTVTAILAKIIASALKVFPQFNASVDMQQKKIIFKKYYNVGIAVDTERGLIVPVLKNVDRMNIAEIAAEIQTLSVKAREKKIGLEELQGGCFTISNLGGIGGTSFTPIVNWPEAAILGVSRSAYEPVFIDGEFVPRLMMPLSLSYDHRVIDGADGIRFLRWVIEVLEQPMKLLIEG